MELFSDKKLIFYIAIFFASIFLFQYLFFSPPIDFPTGQIVKIEQGLNLRDVSKDFKDKRIIRSRVAFESFVIAFGGEKHLAEGDYLFEKKLSVSEVAWRISNKDRHLASVKITIPEGFNNIEIADLVSTKLNYFNKDKFLLTAKQYEGYLFPDTYFFFSSATDEDVLNYMRENFDKKIKSILPKINASNKTEKEILTMASIVEREAKGDNDRGVIAGILWNRIDKKMPLQVDAEMWTYKNKGLPENPICNPGLEAINASILPLKSPYLYYLHDKEGNIHFARTFTEHKQNKLKYLK